MVDDEFSAVHEADGAGSFAVAAAGVEGMDASAVEGVDEWCDAGVDGDGCSGFVGAVEACGAVDVGVCSPFAHGVFYAFLP